MDHDDLTRRVRVARDSFDGHPNGAWSTSEKLAVALILDDIATIQQMGYTALEAADRVRSGMTPEPPDICAYLRQIQRDTE